VQDPNALAAENAIATLPAPGIGPRVVVAIQQLVTPEDYVATAVLPDPQARIAVMQRDGFRGGVHVSYASGPDNYGVSILRFRDPAAAVDYLRAHLTDACTLAVQMVPVDGLDGVAFLRSDNLARAVFVTGDTEVGLDICTCVEVTDRMSLAARWARAVATQLSSKT
jgi:hypothetical protein